MSSDRKSAETFDFWWNGDELNSLQRQRRDVREVLDDRNAGGEQRGMDRPGSAARVSDIQQIDPTRRGP